MNNTDSLQYISISNLLKATPSEESGKRFVYLEASNESRDQQGEVVLAKALANSSGYYMRFGNIDLEHLTQTGKPNPKKGYPGIPNYQCFEIGLPVEVAARNNKTFVKAEIYAGSGVAAENANSFWSSITEINPSAKWYPSVAGSIMGMSPDRSTVTKVRWTNIGFSKTPVNADLATVSTIPFGALAKCWTNDGIDLVKAMEAGYGTPNQVEDGGSLGIQSLAGSKQYSKRRNKFTPIFREIWKGGALTEPYLIQAAKETFNCDDEDAKSFIKQYLSDISTSIKGRK